MWHENVTSLKNFEFSTIEDECDALHQEAIEISKAIKENVNTIKTIYDSVIIDEKIASELISELPCRFQLETPILLFRLSEDGVSFRNLWNKIENAEQSLLIIKTTNNDIFGAYCSTSWNERKHIHEKSKTIYFGTGESFIWQKTKQSKSPIIYKWIGQKCDHPEKCPQMFMTAGDKLLVIGSGGGNAISICDELTSGLSYPCSTFSSPALVKDNAFEIEELEVFNVTNSDSCTTMENQCYKI